jgi:serine/threonine protein kinase/tetratricopeptide (TPR) repeat protein
MTTKPSVPGSVVSPELDLLLDHQSRCWQRGECRRVEAYLRDHPVLGEDADALLDLVYHEILLRTRRGETPALEEYLPRFPQLEAQLRDQFDVHQAMFATPVHSTVPAPPPVSEAHSSSAEPASPAGGAGSALEERASPAVPAEGETRALPGVPGYEILGELGRGGMGVVYRAVQVRLGRPVAFKMIHPHAPLDSRPLARFHREAAALARLAHPNIVQIYEVGEHQGLAYLALELVNGGSLDRRLQGAPQPAREAARLIATLAQAVQYAHERGIVHRDLKPANILLQRIHHKDTKDTKKSDEGVLGREDRKNGSALPVLSAESPPPSALPSCPLCLCGEYLPKIADFGLAKSLDANSAQTRSGDILGTPNYMAPEQAGGRRGLVGPLTDVYALGAILYELLTGRPPFNGATVWDTLEQVLSSEPVPPSRLQPKCPRDLETVCLKCLHKDPGKRYASAEALAQDLHRFLAGEPIRARPTPAWERVWKWVRQRPALVAVCALALLTVAGLLVAHKVRLDAEVALARRGEQEANRRAALAGWRQRLSRAEEVLNAQHWDRASLKLEAVLAELAGTREQSFEGPALGHLQARADRLRDQVSRRLTDQDRYQKLGACVDDARSEELMGTGEAVSSTSSASSPKRPGCEDVRPYARQAVEEALRLFPTTRGGGRLDLDDGYLTADQKKEVREGCCELLLHLARVEGEGQSGDGPGERRRQAARALQVLDRAAGLGVRAASYHRLRARYLARLDETQAARQERRHADGLRPTTAFDCFLRGCDLYREGRVDESVRQLEQVLRLPGNHSGAHYALAICQLKLPASGELRRTRLALARAHLTFCIDQQPGRVWPYLLRGYTQGELQDFEAALADFTRVEEALGVRPNEAAAYGLHVNRGVTRLRQGDLPGAVTDLSEAIRLRPRAYPAYVNLALAYHKQKKEKEAGAQFDQAIALGPPDVAALYRGRARWHQQRGDLESALRDLDQAIGHTPGGAISPLTAADHLDKGRLLLQAGKYPEAVRALGRALELRPGDPGAQRLRAEALLHLGRYAEAIQALDGYLEGHPGREGAAAAYQARARARAQVGDHAGAAEDYTRALGLRPGQAGWHASRGRAYVMLHASTLALRDFDQVLRLAPESVEAWVERGYARVKVGQYREGIDDAERALRLGRKGRVVSAQTLHQAARVFAQASLRAAGDPALPAGAGRELSARYQERALGLVREALGQLSPGQRPSFWRHTVERDPALDPIRRSPGFRQLAQALAASSPG